MIIALALAALAGPARADDDCFAPMSEWRPREAVEALARDKGWDVRRIRIDDGCYEISARDREGRRIEVTVHPATLAVIRTDLKDGEDD